MYAQTPIPDARRTDPATYGEEVTALMRLIRDNCPGPKGERPTMQQLASLLGVTDTTLYSYVPRKAGRQSKPPFPTVFALRVMVAGLPATQAALWERRHGAG